LNPNHRVLAGRQRARKAVMPDKITAQKLISYVKVEVNENTEMPTLGNLCFSPKPPGLRWGDDNTGQQYRSQGCYTYFTHRLAPFLFQRERKRDFARAVTWERT